MKLFKSGSNSTTKNSILYIFYIYKLDSNNKNDSRLLITFSLPKTMEWLRCFWLSELVFISVTVETNFTSCYRLHKFQPVATMKLQHCKLFIRIDNMSKNEQLWELCNHIYLYKKRRRHNLQQLVTAKLLATSRLSMWGVSLNSAVPNWTIPIRNALYSWSAPLGNKPPARHTPKCFLKNHTVHMNTFI